MHSTAGGHGRVSALRALCWERVRCQAVGALVQDAVSLGLNLPSLPQRGPCCTSLTLATVVCSLGSSKWPQSCSTYHVSVPAPPLALSLLSPSPAMARGTGGQQEDRSALQSSQTSFSTQRVHTHVDFLSGTQEQQSPQPGDLVNKPETCPEPRGQALGSPCSQHST